MGEDIKRATLIAYCETAGCYKQVYDYYKRRYNENTLSCIFDENNNELVFSDIED